MKSKFFIIILCCIAVVANAQQSYRDSLMALLFRTKEDTTRVNLLSSLSNNYNYASPDSQFLYAQRGLRLAQSIGYVKGEISCKLNLTNYWWAIGDYATSIKLSYQIVSYAKDQKDTILMLYAYAYLFNGYRDQGDYKQAEKTSFIINELTQKYHSCSFCQISYAMIGSVYYEMNQRDSALYYLSKALNYPKTIGPGWVLLMNGRIQAKMKNSSLAFDYYRQSVIDLQASNNLKDLAGAYISIAELCEKTGYADSAIYYAKQALSLAQQKKFLKEILQSYLFLSNAYEKSNTKISLDYYKLAMAAKDSLYSQEKQRQIVSYKFNEELKQQEEKNTQQQIRNRNRIYTLLSVLAGALLIVIILIRNNKHKQIITTVLKQQKEKVERTLEKLNIANEQLENKNRDLEIEGALEKVRSRTMGMQQSDELLDVVTIVREKMQELEVVMDGGVTIITFTEGTRDAEHWVNNPEQFSSSTRSHVPYFDNPLYRDLFIAKESGMEFFSRISSFEETNTFWKYAFENTDFKYWSDEVKNWILASESFAYSIAFARNSAITVNSLSGQVISEKQSEVLKRFANVFDQAYIRFLDLQKAEAQSREAQVELGLERVRARAMAMQKSDELKELVATVFNELSKLDLTLTRCFIYIIDEKSASYRIWMLNVENRTPDSFHIQFFDHPYLTAFLNAWRERKTNWVYHLKGDEKTAVCDHLFSRTELERLPDIVKAGMREPYGFFLSWSFFNFGGLQVDSIEPLSEANLDILSRFGKVFDLTYTRFNDLKQAEAQTKEAKIEAALEKVRSRSLAMHNSQEIEMVVEELLLRIRELEVDVDVIAILQFNNNYFDRWSGYEAGTVSVTTLPYFIERVPYFNDVFQSRQSKMEVFSHSYSHQEKNEYFNYLFSETNFKDIVSQERKKFLLQVPRLTISIALTKNIGIQLQSYYREAFLDSENNILKRFARVFEQAYTRFLDLQKAEAQAREANVEAALERVRGKAMAMHNSNDLASTASMVFTELRKLCISPIRCGVGLLNKESRKAQLFSATSSPDGDSLALIGWVMLQGHPVLENIYETWLRNEDYYPELTGDQLHAYYQLLLSGLPVTAPDPSAEQKQYGHFLPFSEGCLYAWADTRYTDSQTKILKRFAAIIDLTFQRYIELQKSEANAREAVKQAALDRVRADIASMRTISDLDRITPLIWNELTILGTPFIRCGVFIMDEEQQLIHTFLSTPDGKAIAAFHLPYDTPGKIAEALSHWKNKEKYLDHWDEAEFNQFAEILVKEGALASAENYLKTVPKGGFYLHFVPFLQGMLYVGNTNRLSDEEINLIQSVADAFSTAYARYEDFNKLEAAKKQVDKTLVELKQAQTQLIQSEKMASLGELTAGVAHEIQNPLNFINNFSDVNKELIEEMKEEISKRNFDEVKSIMNNIRDNEQKINHHGKRADAIVKGMLQHSRASTGKKELTDINALADEYLRLSYHGFRAKDKSFNAGFETDFDESIGKIEVVPQDIGRVLLNLYNNAFHAVAEKKKHQGDGYLPTVKVATKRLGNKIEIVVSDNGTGIPDKVIDKIFQPFFTTKPTGQGTGLGLSLSYDIIKAHGGEIKVETKEGEGSEFIIQLPV